MHACLDDRWQCTVKGGREGRDIDAVELAKAVQELGAGEILLNCIDRDGRCAAHFFFCVSNHLFLIIPASVRPSACVTKRCRANNQRASVRNKRSRLNTTYPGYDKLQNCMY